MAVERFRAFLESLRNPNPVELWAPKQVPPPMPQTPMPQGAPTGMPPPDQGMDMPLKTGSLDKAIASTQPPPPLSMPDSKFVREAQAKRKAMNSNNATKPGRLTYGE